MTKRIPVPFSLVGRTNPIMEHTSWNHISSNQLVGDENVPKSPKSSSESSAASDAGSNASSSTSWCESSTDQSDTAADSL